MHYGDETQGIVKTSIEQDFRFKKHIAMLSALLRLFTKFGLRTWLVLIKCPCMVRTKLEKTSLSALLRLFTKFGLRLWLVLIKCPCMVRTKLEKTSLSALLKI